MGGIPDIIENKANLRDLIAATSLIILLKLDPNRRFFSPCELEIWWMILNNTALLLYYIKLCASFPFQHWIQTGVKVRKSSIQVEIGDILSRVTLKFDGWPWKTLGNIYTTLSFVYHIEAMGEFKLELQFGNARFGSKSAIFLWHWKTIRLCCFKPCASFHSHSWIQPGVTVQKCPIWVKIDFLALWPWNLMDDLEKQ